MRRTSISMGLCAAFVLGAVVGSPIIAQGQVSSFAEITGHDFGERITVHHEMVSYLEYLAEASPRVTVVEQGRSWEGRRLLLAIVTSPANHARLESIRDTAQRLGDPRKTSADEAASLAADQPAVVFMGGSIHGFELSGAEAVLKLLEHMTTRDDPETMEVLDGAVLLLDPMLNPDGRDAFASRNHEMIGKQPTAVRDDWSNDFSRWEAVQFRTGHYFFDNNRDWWAHTQDVTRYRVPTLVAWRPQVVIDLHEMGPDVEFYFDPPSKPFGPYFPEFSKVWLARFGDAYAQAFDDAGFEYMTRERFNFFYPGYTSSYGNYQGAVGMLYEQGSTRGLALERADESVRQLDDALTQHYTAAWTAAQTAARNRQELLRDYHQGLGAAVEDGKSGITRYLLPPEGDPQLLKELVSLLLRNGIEVGRLSQDAQLASVRDRYGDQAGNRSFAAGTYVVEAAQPRNRLVRALLEPQLPMPDEFLEEARQRIDRGENPRFYDITAWSLPLLFDQPAFSSSGGGALEVELVSTGASVGSVPSVDPRYAYVFDGKQVASLAALRALREKGHRAAVTLIPTRISGQDLSSGSVVLRLGQNEAQLHADVREAAEHFDLALLGVDTGMSEPDYPALGSSEVIPFKTPEIAVLAGQPVHGYSFGWAWYTLDRQYEIPVTVRNVSSLASTPIHRFNVIVMPHLFSAEEMATRLGEDGVRRLQQWVQDGGSLVAIGSAVDFVREHLELTEVRSWYEPQDPGGEVEESEAEGDSKEETQSSVPEPQRFSVPGALLRVELDQESWLSAGVGNELPAMVTSDRIYLEPEGAPDSNQRSVARYASTDPLVLSGHIWAESEERLPGTLFAYEERVGEGRVILFVEDPNFRAYWRGANRLFLNAVVLSPSAP